MADVIVKDAEGQPQTYRGIKRVILQTEGGEATFFDEIEAGEGIVIEGSTIKVDPTKVPVAERDSWYAGLVPRVSEVVDGVPVWSYYFTSVDAVPYAGVMRDGNGSIAGIQNKLYVHEGSLSAYYSGEGHTVYYRAISAKAAAFTTLDEIYATTLVNMSVPYEATGNSDALLTVRLGAGSHIRIAASSTNGAEVDCQSLTLSSDTVVRELA